MPHPTWYTKFTHILKIKLLHRIFLFMSHFDAYIIYFTLTKKQGSLVICIFLKQLKVPPGGPLRKQSLTIQSPVEPRHYFLCAILQH